MLTMRTIMITGVLAGLLAFCGCEQINRALGQSEDLPAPPPAVPFVPPADDTVTAHQFGLWKAINPVLDSLTYFYADSFKVKDPVHTLRIQEDFMLAQDIICRLIGLTGGYAEYRWVTNNIGRQRNRKLHTGAH